MHFGDLIIICFFEIADWNLTMNNFWQEIKSPAFSLAPMEDVTDTVFREIVLGMAAPGKLHVVMTEFTSVEGMNHPKGRERVSERLIVNDSERELLKSKNVKLVAQIWGRNPEVYHTIAKHISENYDFDGLDINMGCPVKKVVKTGTNGVMIGRGIFQNPWFFNPEKIEISEEERIERLIQHTRLFEQIYVTFSAYHMLGIDAKTESCKKRVPLKLQKEPRSIFRTRSLKPVFCNSAVAMPSYGF